MKVDPYPYILTIDTVADAVQFTDANTAAAIVEWINDLARSGSEPAASYDPAANIIALPSSTRPSRLEIGWWAVRWPSGDFAAHRPASLASMFDPPTYIGHRADDRVEQHRERHDCAVLRVT